MRTCSTENLRMGNSNIKIRQKIDEEGTQKRVKMEKCTAGIKKRSADCLTAARVYRPHAGGRYSRRQWMNRHTNLTCMYNPSTTLWWTIEWTQQGS